MHYIKLLFFILYFGVNVWFKSTINFGHFFGTTQNKIREFVIVDQFCDMS